MIRQALIILLILMVGAAVLAPAVMFLDPEPLPGDFYLTWNNARLHVPVIYSLCASIELGLLYFVMKR